MAPNYVKETIVLAKVIIKRIGVLSLGKILGILYAISGLILSLISAIFPSIGLFGGVFVIAFPILYGIMGFVSGVATAFLYNVVAEKIGGLEIETKR